MEDAPFFFVSCNGEGLLCNLLIIDMNPILIKQENHDPKRSVTQQEMWKAESNRIRRPSDKRYMSIFQSGRREAGEVINAINGNTEMKQPLRMVAFPANPDVQRLASFHY